MVSIQIQYLFGLLFFISAWETMDATDCELRVADCGAGEAVGTLHGAAFNGTCGAGGAVALLKRGTKVMIKFTFESTELETDLTSKVCGKIGPLPCVNFPLDQPDACKTGLTCPVAANTQQTLGAVLDIKTIYPAVNVMVKWELLGQDGKQVFCGLIKGHIL